jgi:hypothetical protein
VTGGDRDADTVAARLTTGAVRKMLADATRLLGENECFVA